MCRLLVAKGADAVAPSSVVDCNKLFPLPQISVLVDYPLLEIISAFSPAILSCESLWCDAMFVRPVCMSTVKKKKHNYFLVSVRSGKVERS